jgi:hypothetical protein
MGRFAGERSPIYRQSVAEATRAQPARHAAVRPARLGLRLSPSSAKLARASRRCAEARVLMQGKVPPGSPPALAADTAQGRLALLRGRPRRGAAPRSTRDARRVRGRKLANGSVVMLHIWRSEAALRQHRADDALARRAAMPSTWRARCRPASLVEPRRAGEPRPCRCPRSGRPRRGAIKAHAAGARTPRATPSARSIRRRDARRRCRLALIGSSS